MIIQTNSTVWLVFRGTEWPTLDPVDIYQDEQVGAANAQLRLASCSCGWMA